MRWKFLNFFYFKQMGKSKLYMGALILLFLLLAIRLVLFFSGPHEMEAYGQLPSELAMIVQMVSIFYILFFYQLHSKEMLYGLQSFFLDGYRIMLEKISSMLTAHFLIQTIVLVAVYILYSFTFLLVGIELSSFYLSLFRFLAIYMFAPLVITMLYGVIIAMLFGRKKISFFAVLFIWIITGSMVTELFSGFFKTVQANEWQALLFIGLNAVMYVYQSFNGFDLHIGNELKIFTWFLALVGIMLLLSLQWTLKTRERNFVLKVVMMIFLLAIGTAYGTVHLSGKTFNRADQISETNYYRNLSQTDADLNYEIEAYSISIEKQEATVEIIFSQLSTLEPTFQLYHAYPVRWIQAGGNLVEYVRNGDLINIQLPTKTSSLIFHYEIIDTNLVPAMSDKSLLMADKAWYPKKRDSHMYEFNEKRGGIEVSESFMLDENYSFTLKVDEYLFSNLSRNGEILKGTTQAVTLLKGEGNQLTYENYHITYPADWPDMEKRVPFVLSLLEETMHEVQQFAPTTVPALPKAIVFSNFGLTSFMTNDHFVLNTGYSSAVDGYDTTKDFQENVLRHAVERKASAELHGEWINIAGQYIRQKKGWQIDMPGRSADSHLFQATDQETVELIYQTYQSLPQNQRARFLQEWYSEMDETWTWEYVLQFMEEWN